MRWSGILLLSCLSLPFLGIVTVFHFQKSQIRREIKHKIIDGLDPSELARISLHKNDLSQLRWEHSKEFEFEGEMYDVVSTIETKDSITYWCWWDYEETTLNQALKHQLAQALNTNPLRNQATGQLIVLLKTPVLIPEVLCFRAFHSVISPFRTQESVQVRSPNHAPDSPPPKRLKTCKIVRPDSYRAVDAFSLI